jgi:microcystin-dependent protein
MAKIVSKNTGDVPGTIKSHGSSSEPNGYLICDGRSLSQTEFKALFQSIGTSFGNGSTGTVFGTPGGLRFNLPDLRGRFLRGTDGTAGNDPNKTSRTAMAAGGATANNIGSVQNDQMQSHKHFSMDPALAPPGKAYQNLVPALAAFLYEVPGYGNVANGTYVTSPPIVDGTNGTPRIGLETRPKNAYVNYIIKF